MGYQEFLNTLEDICVLVAITYFLSRTRLFSRVFVEVSGARDKWLTFLFFGSLALTEILLSHGRTSQSTRVVSATAAGLMGGPAVGFGVGGLTGMAAALIRGPQAAPDGIAAVIGGLLSGWVYLYGPPFRQKVLAGFLAGAMSHSVWLAMTLSKDFLLASSWQTLLVQYCIPVLTNGAAVALFLIIIGDVRAHHQRIEREELSRAIRIAGRVLPTLGASISREAAEQIAETVRRLIGAPAVAVVSGDSVAVFTGIGADHHDGQMGVAARECLAERSPRQLDRAEARLCERRDCPLTAVMAAPLNYRDEIVGCVEVYESGGRRLSADVAQLGAEIAQFMFDYHMQSAELSRQTEAVARAELKALQAQVHPHFLFNALNTVAGLCEMDPERAAGLTVKLGDFFRGSLRNDHSPMCSLSEELRILRSYLEIEKARFGERLTVVEEIEPGTEKLRLPCFALQPLVENALLHGLSNKTEPGTLRIVARRRNGRLVCWVIDDGRGSNVALDDLLKGSDGESHAIPMLWSRLRGLYEDGFGLRMRSRPGKGTAVCLWVPVETEMG